MEDGTGKVEPGILDLVAEELSIPEENFKAGYKQSEPTKEIRSGLRSGLALWHGIARKKGCQGTGAYEYRIC